MVGDSMQVMGIQKLNLIVTIRFNDLYSVIVLLVFYYNL